MLAIDYEITSFVCLIDDYVTVVEGISRDSLEACHKIFSGCTGRPFDCNVFAVTSKDFDQRFYFVRLLGWGQKTFG